VTTTAMRVEPLDAPVAEEVALAALERALRVAGKRVFALSSLPGQPTRVDRSGYLVLGTLAEHGELRLSDMAGALLLDISTVSRQVRQLEAAGLVTRRPDPADRRAALIATTPRGDEQVSMLRRQRIALLERALSGWSAADRRHLIRLTERLGDALHAAPLVPPIAQETSS